MDCVEIIRGNDARASAVPRLLVVDERAKLTHEAAIGSVDKKQVETLMGRGLTEEKAVGMVCFLMGPLTRCQVGDTLRVPLTARLFIREVWTVVWADLVGAVTQPVD